MYRPAPRPRVSARVGEPVAAQPHRNPGTARSSSAVHAGVRAVPRHSQDRSSGEGTAEGGSRDEPRYR